MYQHKKDDPSDPFAMLSGGDPPDDFPDWNNPEDQEDAPQGYYDDEADGDDDTYEPGPGDPDYDLSEAAGYAGWEAPERSGLLPQWVIVVGSILLILAMVIPVLLLVR